MKNEPQNMVAILLPETMFLTERKCDSFSFVLESDCYEFSEDEVNKVEIIIRSALRNRLLSKNGLSKVIAKDIESTFIYKKTSEDEEYHILLWTEDDSKDYHWKIFVGHSPLGCG